MSQVSHQFPDGSRNETEYLYWAVADHAVDAQNRYTVGGSATYGYDARAFMLILAAAL